jgi:hypothetical protein
MRKKGAAAACPFLYMGVEGITSIRTKKEISFFYDKSFFITWDWRGIPCERVSFPTK